ncbi:MAG: hypothetical protein CFH10_02204, partial [Alphaproteobacteria bacterium MarineAlpha4_Bin2]
QFSYSVSDGEAMTPASMSVMVHEVNDIAVITGGDSGVLTEDGADLMASGDLDATDIDSSAAFIVQTATAVPYGTFSITVDGGWSFELDNNHPDVQSLTAGEQLDAVIPVATSDGTTQNITITINGSDEILAGRAIDGYIEGATVFADTDGDGILDVGEAFTTTGIDGEFTLTNAEGPLVLTGGTDAATGLPFKGVLEAPAGSTVVTPLTTIINRLMEAQSVDAASAESQVKAAFALDETVSLTTFDPVAGALSDDPVISEQGVDIAATGVIVQNLVVQASSAIAAATDGTVDVNAASTAVFAALAGQINSLQENEELPATLETVQTVINMAAANTDLGLSTEDQTDVADASDEVASVVIEGQTALIESFSAMEDAGTFSPVSALMELAQSAVVSQTDAAADIQAAVNAAEAGDTAALENLVVSYSGDNLEAALDTATIGDVTGSEVNYAPVGTDDFVEIQGGPEGPTVIDVNDLLVNDFDLDTQAIDLSIIDVTNPVGGVVSLGEGTITVTPDAEYDGGSVSFDYVVSDGEGGTDTATVMVKVSQPPALLNETITLNEDEEGVLSVTQSVLLANDFDPDTGDNEDLDIVSVQNAVGGSVELDENGNVRFTPVEGQVAELSFEYTVADAEGAISSAVATINRPPELFDDLWHETIEAGSILLVDHEDLLSNDADPDVYGASSLDIITVDGAVGGSVEFQGSEIAFTPDKGFAGTASFDYTVSDNLGGFDTATFEVDVDVETDVVTNVEKLVFDDNVITVTTYQSGDVKLEGTETADVINFSGPVGVTLEGHAGNDILRGGSGDDVFDGGLGDDFIDGGGGDDLFLLSQGNDVIRAGSGHDRLEVDSGFELLGATLDLASGDLAIDFDHDTGGLQTLTIRDHAFRPLDEISFFQDGMQLVLDVADASLTAPATDSALIAGSVRDDEITGNIGNDLIYANSGDDHIVTNDGQDLIFAATGDDVIDAGAGDDTVYGDLGDDTIDGGADDDTITAGEGDDTVHGSAGDDTIYGEA